MVGDPLVVTALVAVASLILFVTEWTRPAYTALAIVVALLVLGVLDTADGFAGVSNNATVTVLCMFILAAAVERTGILSDLAARVLSTSEGHPRRAFVLLLVLAGVASAVLNNTPIVALLIPLVLTIARRVDESASRYLIPLSFVAMLGGTMTLVGTSGNLVGASIAADLGYEPFGIFSFLKVGGVAFGCGLAYLALVGHRLAPPRRSAGGPEERFELSGYLSEVVVTPGSELAGQRISESNLRYGYDVEVLDLHRETGPRAQILADVVIEEGDVLVVSASSDELVRLVDEAQVALAGDGPGAAEIDDTELVEVTVSSGPHVARRTLREARFRERYGAEVVAIRRGREVIHERLPEVELRAGDTLLVHASDLAVRRLERSRSIALAEPVQTVAYRRSKAPIAVGTLLAVVLVGALGWLPLPVAAIAGVLVVGVTGCLAPYEVFEAVDWQVIVVLAGLIPLGLALRQSGATGVVASTISEQLGHLDPLWVLAIVWLVTALTAQVITSVASIGLMVPVAARVAETLGLAGRPFILATILAGSAGFLTPIGYQTNLMVYGPGEYRFTDYVRVGLPLLVIVGTATIGSVAVLFPLE